MLASTLTSKGQTTIPIEVREALNLKSGDKVLFEVKDQQAVISKIEPFDYLYHHALTNTLIEWTSGYDDEAYHDL